MRIDRTRVIASIAALALCLPLTGCLVMGYSSGSGLWLWSGSIGLTLILLALMLLFNRRH
jgi:hypothetical protein